MSALRVEKYELMIAYMGNHLESYKTLIGKKIQKRRIEKGYANQSLLAGKLGVDQSQVSKWESGKNIPEGQLKAALRDLLQVDDDFFELIELTPIINLRCQLIIDIQVNLMTLSDDQLETVAAFVGGLSQLSQSEKSKQAIK